MSEAHIRIRGQRELEAAFMDVRREVVKELRPALLAAAEPVRSEAQSLAVQGIRNIGPQWSRMRIGATPKAVYLAPRSKRRSGSPRPNLAWGLALAMQNALEAKQEEVIAAVTVVVDVSAARNGFL
jgi:hypothetical protein